MSPGSAAGDAHAAPACPTFSWTADTAAGAGYELLIERAEPAAHEAQAPPVREVLPAGATTWTLPGERCLDPGRYAWTVRSLPGETAWAEPRLFRVEAAAAAPLPDLVAALAALSPDQRRLVRRLLEEPDAIRPLGEPGLGAPEGILIAVRGEVSDPTGETYGVEGVATSLDGAGLHAVHTDPSGTDLLLDGPSPVALSDTGLTVDSPDPENFSFANDGAGSLTLSLDGANLVTTATDRDTLGGLSCAGGQIAEWNGSDWVCGDDDGETYLAGNQLELAGSTFHVLEGSASGLDADTLDGLDSSDFLTGAHDHFANAWSGAAPVGLQVDNASPGTSHFGLAARMTSTASGTFSAGLRGENLGLGANGYGIWGSHAGDGFGVFGESAGIAGVGVAGLGRYGVQGVSALASGSGVYGQATAGAGAGKGVRGESLSPDGFGVLGDALATSGQNAGVYGQTASASGAGVWGRAAATGGGHGVRGESTGANGTAVYGVASAPAATGVHGQTDSPSGKGVFGWATAGTGETYGVQGVAGSENGRGVAGFATATTGSPHGVYGQTASSGGAGVYGLSVATGADSTGVRGVSDDIGVVGLGGQSGVRGESSAVGVLGLVVAGVSGAVAVLGETSHPDSKAVMGISRATTGFPAAIWGAAAGGAGHAGFFSGDVLVTGSLSKGGGSFKIDHPLDPANKYLYHSFVESPEMLNLYDGIAVLDAAGRAWVELPPWFEALNRDFRYQLTALGRSVDLWIAKEIQDNRFLIAGNVAGARISWQVTGVRHDAWAEAHRIPVEEDKLPEDRGRYLHPLEQGMHRETGVDWDDLMKVSESAEVEW